MSARPDVHRLSDEDLDLLISRSLDGDLPPEDQKLLEEALASDPHAAARRDDLAGVVSALSALPAPGAPLGMSARIAAAAAERSSGLAGVSHRLGIFPPPTMVRGIAAVFAIVVVGIYAMRSQSERAKKYEQLEATAVAKAAERSEGAVSVFFEEKKQGPDANASATAGAAADAVTTNAPAAPAAPPAKLARKASEARRDADLPARSQVAGADARQNEVGWVAGLVAQPPSAGNRAESAVTARSKDETAAAIEADRANRKTDAFKEGQVASSAVASLRDEAVSKRAKVAREAEAPPRVTAQAAAAAPVSAPAALSSPRLAWSVSVIGTPGWMLGKAPDSVAGRLFATRCVVSIDAAGRVTEVRPAGAPLPKDVDEFVRGLVFVPEPPGEKAPAPGDIEIEVRSR